MGKSVAAGAASLADQVDRQRRGYVEFKKAFRRKHHDAMIKEMRSLDEKVIRLQERVSRALRSLVPLAWRILYLPLDHRTAAQIAGKEFDHLASTPGVMAIGVDSKAECLLVTVRRPPADEGPERDGSEKGTRVVRIGLLAPTVHVDEAPWAPERGWALLRAVGLQVRERMLAAELLGAGNLPGLMAEVIPDMCRAPEDSPSQGSAQPSESVARGMDQPVEAPEARRAYIKRRARDLVECGHSDALARAEKEIYVATRDLNSLVRRAGLISAALEAMGVEAHQDDEAFGREYDELLEHPGIRRIEVRGSRVRAVTEPVVLVSSTGRRHLIGSFIIDIHSGDRLEMHNIGPPPTGVRHGCDHPHVRSGICCFGNIKSLTNRLIVSNDIRGLVHLAVEYLFSLNETSTFASVEAWPTVDEKGELLEEQAPPPGPLPWQ